MGPSVPAQPDQDPVTEGNRLFNQGKYSEAIIRYEQAIALDKSDRDALKGSCAAYYQVLLYDKALDACQRLLALNPEDPDAWLYSGYAQANLGRFSAALESADAAMACQGADKATFSESWNLKAFVYAKMNRYDLDLYAANLSITNNTANAEAWNAKGVSLYHLGKYQAALDAGEQAIMLNPKKSAFWQNKGDYLAKLGRAADAENAYTTAKTLAKTVAGSENITATLTPKPVPSQDTPPPLPSLLDWRMMAGLILVFCASGGGFYLLYRRKPGNTITATVHGQQVSSPEPGKFRGMSFCMSNQRPFRSSALLYAVVILDLLITLLFGTIAIGQTFLDPAGSTYHTSVGIIFVLLISANFFMDLVFVYYLQRSPEKIGWGACLVRSIVGFLGIFTVLSGIYFLVIYLIGVIRMRDAPTAPAPAPAPAPANDFTPRLDALSARAAKLAFFGSPAGSLIADLYGKIHDTGTPLTGAMILEAEAGLDRLESAERKVLQWKRQGYDTGALENLRTGGVPGIQSAITVFEQNVGRLEIIRSDLADIIRNNPAVATREEFRAGITALEHQLKNPDAVNAVTTGLESLKTRIREYPPAQERYEKQLQNQIDRIRQAVSDDLVLEETDRIQKKVQAGDLPAAVELLRNLSSDTITRVEERIAALRREGAVIPGSIHGERPDPDQRKYSDRIIEAMAGLEEIGRFTELFTEAASLKDAVTDPGLLVKYDAGDYTGFIMDYHNRKISRKKAGLIFISAKSEDYPYAHPVYNFLIEQKYDVFFSRDSLPEIGNCEFGEAIDAALEKARHIIIVTSSRENVQSKWVKSEWRMFLDEKRAGRKNGNIITLLAANMRIEDLPIGLRSYETKFLDDPKTLELILHYLH